MNLSPNFTLDEFIVSQTAVRKGIDNTPSKEVVDNLSSLCKNILEPLHDEGLEIIVSSGYRSIELNKAIGGAATSQHCKGQAVDILAKGYPVEYLYLFIKNSGLPFDQLIQEFDRWVHVSFNQTESRKECLRATKVNGVTQYSHDK